MSLRAPVLSLVAAVALASSSTIVLTGCGSKSSSKGSSSQTSIEMTGIESFDNLFEEAKDVDDRLTSARTSFRTGRSQIATTVGLAENTRLADSLEELKSKANDQITVKMEGGTPTLSAKDAVTTDVQAGIDAVNTYVGTVTSALADLRGIKDEAAELKTAVAGFPEQLQKDYKSLGVSATELPGALSTLNTNIKIVGGLPDKADSG